MQPGQLGSQIQGDDALVRRIADLERAVKELAAQNNLATAGISVQPNGITITGSETVKGDLVVSGTETVSGALNVTGSETVSGDLTVTGTLNLPNGSINNAALLAPVKYDATFNDGPTSLNVTATEQTVASMTFTVPDGFTTALVLGFGSIGVVNPTASTASIAGRVYIDEPAGSHWGPQRFQAVAPNTDGAVSPLKQVQVTGLTGGNTITCRLVILNTGPDWGATSGGASINGFALWTR